MRNPLSICRIADLYSITIFSQMIELYKDPEGENVFAQTYSGGEEMSLGNRGTIQPQKEAQLGSSTEDTLRRRIKQLEDILSTYTVRFKIVEELHYCVAYKCTCTQCKFLKSRITLYMYSAMCPSSHK